MENLEGSSPIDKITTRSVGIRFGLIMGAVGVIYFLIASTIGLDMNQGIWKWASLSYVIVILFYAHKYFKDNGNGYMSFGEGVGISFWVGLISAPISSIVSYIYWKLIDSSMIQLAIDQARQKMENEGKMSEEQIDQAMSMASKFMTPESFLIIGLIFGVIMIVIIGLLITIFTQKRNPEPTYN